MALTLETLLKPISEDQPSGEDLSYDNERAELELAFQREDADPDGETAEVEQDWRAVLKLIEAQFARTKDVWLAVYLARAGAESGSLETVELGVQVLAGLFEQYWATVHPQLEELGVPGRKAPCDALANRRAFLGPMEKTILISHPRLGRFSAADIERFRSEGGAAEGYGSFRATLDELGPESLVEALARIDSMEGALRRADRAFMNEAVGEETPNYSPTYALLTQIKTSLRSFMPGEPDTDTDTGGGGDAAPAGGASGRSDRSVSGAVNSRDDVIRVLDLVAGYYRQREPGHPMLLMMERAKLWVTMDFFTLMKDIAPEGFEQAEKILKTRSDLYDED